MASHEKSASDLGEEFFDDTKKQAKIAFARLLTLEGNALKHTQTAIEENLGKIGILIDEKKREQDKLEKDKSEQEKNEV